MNYWEKRASFLENKNFQKSNDLIRLIEKEHKLAMKKIESDIDFYLSRIAMEGNLSVAEARKLLSKGELDHFRMSLGDYIEAGKGSLTEDIRSQLELASNLHHISRQQAMAIELKKHIDSLYNKYLGETTKYLATSYEESFYQSLYDLGKFEGFKSFQKLNTIEIDSIIKRPWAEDGQNFSDRIWKNQEKLINSLQEELLGSVMRGDKIDRAVKNLAEKMEVSKSNASRLIRTESAFISNLAMTNAYEKGTCEKYEILATLDLKTSEICRHMDGKKFPFKDKLVGVNHPPFHPNCRTVTIPCYDDDIERRLDEKSGRLTRDPETGKSKPVENLTYKKWYNKYIRDNPEAIFKEKAWKNRQADKKQFSKYRNVLGEDLKNNFKDFQEIKHKDEDKYRLIKIDYKRRKKLIDNPNLLLPNVDKAYIDKRKFTEYLFGGTNQDGLIKGSLINKKLGYNINNYKEFEEEILIRARIYPAKLKTTGKYGSKYETRTIFYGKNEEPVNVEIGWLVNGDKTHLTSIYINEVNKGDFKD